MALSPGTRLGHYDVTSLIGEGGMGQVWQATDTQLNRQVALKILPDAFADDPDRLARFTREAQILASLNHPNIAAIHGIEEAEGTRALVLELVEGPTLADRIAKGPIPLDEALPIAKQIAEALEAAHEAGVIHRDLKPANIKVREDGTVKVLDFGLAKELDPSSESDPSQSPTLTAAATQMGVIMGTAAYMSPEQARGKTVDKRSDIWAFGVVLFEMLTGKKAFPGDDLTDTIAAVVRGEPAWGALPEDVPARLTEVLRACLQKDRTQRVRDVGDVMLAIEGRFEPTVSAPQGGVLQPAGWRQALPLIALAVITGVAVWSLTRPAVPQVSRFTFTPPPGVEVTGLVRFSPDGRVLAFQGIRDGVSQVYLRYVDRLEVVPLPGTEGTAPVAFSADGELILVQEVRSSNISAGDGMLKRVPLRGGPPTPVGVGGGGAAWGPDDDTIIIAGVTGLRLLHVQDRRVEPLTTPVDTELGHFYPTLLPDGRTVLFHASTGTAATTQVAVYDLELDERTDLFDGTMPLFTTTGHLTFWRDGDLWAVPFDPDSLEVGTNPTVVVCQVSSRWRGLHGVGQRPPGLSVRPDSRRWGG